MEINLFKFGHIRIDFEFTPSRKRRIMNELKTKGRIPAVKLHRELYNSNLLEAKNQVDKWAGLSEGEFWTNNLDTYGNRLPLIKS